MNCHHSMKTQNEPFFVNHNDQLAAVYQQMDEKKIKEYENYFNYLHFNINHQPQNNYYTPPPFVPPPTPPPHLPFSHLALSPPPTPFNLPFSYIASTPPPTPVTLAFSHIAFPTSDRCSPLQNDNIINDIPELPEKIYAGEEASIWGPGQLGLFAKTPNDLDAFLHKHDEIVPSRGHMNENKLKPNRLDDATWLQASSVPSAKSPPGYENRCHSGLVAKNPNQVNTYLNTADKMPKYQLAKNKPKTIQVGDATKLYVSSLSSSKSPPGFEHRCLASG